MWPRFLAVQTQYGCSPWETTCCISEHCPSKALPKMLQTLTVCWTGLKYVKPCRIRPRRDDFYEDGPEILSTAEVSQLLLSGVPATPSEVWLVMGWWLVLVGYWPGTRQNGAPRSTAFLWTNLAKDYRGGHPKHRSSVFCRHQGI